jgi:hypothetical protein
MTNDIMGKNYPELIAKFAKASLNFKDVFKSKEGQIGNQKYKYATLKQIEAATYPHLHKEGLKPVTTFDAYPHLGRNVMICSLKYGDSAIISKFILPEVAEEGRGSREQREGIIISYYRRYLMSALLGISSDEDIDGATGHGTKTPQQKKVKQDPKSDPYLEGVKKAQANLRDRVKSSNMSTEAFKQVMLALTKKKSSKDLTPADIDILNKELDKYESGLNSDLPSPEQTGELFK